jgi:hypothetical protein
MENQTMAAGQSDSHKIVKGPKALFWFLTLFFSLGITAFSTGGLWFQFVNKWFPLAINYGQVSNMFSQTVLKWQMASLIIAVPLFFVLSLLIRRALKAGHLAADNKVRLWITYIILFIVVATAVGDLITAVFSLLNGDFTTRFLLKCLVILVIATWIFVYYWQEIRSAATLNNSPLPRIFGLVSLALIVGSFIGTFFIIESPMTSRLRAFDQTRVYNLSEVKYAIDDYYREYGKLPADLKELNVTRGNLPMNDPKTGQSYQYEISGNESYKLCADFDSANKGDQADYSYPGNNEFLHDAGHVCFDRKVNIININKDVPPAAPAEPINQIN